MKYLVVGLGNAGPEYENTRHNIGFRVVDAFADARQLTFESARYAYIANTKIKNKELYLAKPTTLVNLSGKAVRYWLKALNVPLANLLVITDDLDLPLGKLKLKKKGGDAGHNGMKDIIHILENKNFPRLRIGIGKDYPRGRQVQYVLGEWTPEENKVIEPKVKKAADLIRDWMFEGIDKAMNKYNE